MQALSELDVRALMTVGHDVDLDSLPGAPPSVRVERWVPQADAFPHASAVVCHGGTGSTLGALAAGLPLVVVPLFADQPYNARRVDAVGAGLTVEPDAAAIRDALRRVLEDESFRGAVEALASEMRAQQRIDTAVDLIAGLARTTPTRSSRAASR
jgi:MGT family glycosyltransferase